MMTIFLSSIGMKHHKHWELIGWFLLLAQPCSFGLNRLIDAGTCVTFDFIDESDNTLEAQSPWVAITSHYMILLLSCHCYLWRVLKV
jgi:hypothetical protein